MFKISAIYVNVDVVLFPGKTIIDSQNLSMKMKLKYENDLVL